jgi:hypothetical protein
MVWMVGYSEVEPRPVRIALADGLPVTSSESSKLRDTLPNRSDSATRSPQSMVANCDTTAPRAGSAAGARSAYRTPAQQCRLHFGLVKRVGDPKEGSIAQESLSI